jgi:cell division septum initiation protein DivIVA
MTTTDISEDADAVDSSKEANIVAEANEEAKQILARSRYEAFRLVTEARDEAETILDEARAEAAGTVKAATITAESKVDAAEIRATQIVEEAQSRAANLAIASQDVQTSGSEPDLSDNSALEAEHEELAERVSSLRVLADKLEDRFAALAANAPTAPEQRSHENTDSTSSGIDHAPSVAPEAKVTSDSVAEEPTEDRGSFYSRRSAKLPSIGAAGGQSALDMTRSIRSKLESDS